MDYVILQQTCQGRPYVLTVVEANHWMAGDLRCASSLSSGNMAPQKELNKAVGLMLKRTSWTPGLENIVISWCITFSITHEPLGKPNSAMDC